MSSREISRWAGAVHENKSGTFMSFRPMQWMEGEQAVRKI